MTRPGATGLRSAVAAGWLALLVGFAASSATAQSIVDRLREAGFADVVIRLDVPEPSYGKTSAADVSRLAADVAARQDRFLDSYRPASFEAFRRLRYSPVVRLRIRSEAELRALREHPLVTDVHPDDGFRAAYDMPVVTRTSDRWKNNVAKAEGNGTVSTARLDLSVSRIRADRLHALGLTGRGVTVAVIDSGIDLDHPRLRDAVQSEVCFISDTVEDGLEGTVCPDGRNEQTGAGSAADDNGHGTSVAGIVASRGEAGREVGVAPEAGLVVVKVLNSEGRSGSLLDLAAGLEWLFASGLSVDVVNMSVVSDMGFTTVCDGETPSNRAIRTVVNLLASRGVVIVASSGNGGLSNTIRSPACITDVTSVGAVDSQDQLAMFTDAGPLLDLVAPGTAIRTTRLGGSTVLFGGTSAAAPHVAGCAALLKSGVPGLSAHQYVEGLIEAGPVMVADPRANDESYPLLDCRAAFELIRHMEPADPRPVNGPAPVLQLYPNPAAGRAVISIHSPESRLLTVRVFDVLGRAQLHHRVFANAQEAVQLPFDASRLPTGTYYVRVTGTQRPHTAMLVVR